MRIFLSVFGVEAGRVPNAFPSNGFLFIYDVLAASRLDPDQESPAAVVMDCRLHDWRQRKSIG
jgi:hypothetical protein